MSRASTVSWPTKWGWARYVLWPAGRRLINFSSPGRHLLQTIQSISLLAWLAETHNIWGPFLVVAPTSTVHNWQAELTRFVPRLKVLPHWGTPADREVIRREWTRPAVTFTEDAPFHIVVTSYDMVHVFPEIVRARQKLTLVPCVLR
jgi:hypothetical protein